MPSLQETSLRRMFAQPLPSMQVSAVQALPSSQGPVRAGLTQPLPGKQASLVHGLLSSHEIAAPATH